MKLCIKYIDNNLEINSNEIQSVEIENKRYFYRIVDDLYTIYNGNIVEDISLLDDNNNEINYLNKFKIFVNYFDFGLNSKKYSNDILKCITNNISDENKDLLTKQYNKIVNIYKNILNDIDLPLLIDSEINIDNVTKLMKININTSKDLLSNLFILIDSENLFQTKNILIFINLKQYLTNNELEELYKYSAYNEIPLLLIDSQSYGTTLNNEKKLIIDENLDEFMLQ